MFGHLIAVAAVLYAFYGVANLFAHGDSAGGTGAIIIGVGGILMFFGRGMLGIIAIGVGIGLTFMGQKNPS